MPDEFEDLDLFNDEDLEIDLENLDDTIKKAMEQPEHRISECCGNCKYFFYSSSNQRRGVCVIIARKYRKDRMKIPAANDPHKKYSLGGSRKDFMEARSKYPKTHVTCICNNFEIRTRGILNAVTKYCGAKYKKKND